MTKVTCPQCGSDDVERGRNPFVASLIMFGMGGIFIFVGMLFWPLLIAAFLAVVLAIIGFIRALLDIRKKENKCTWKCKKCKYSFTHVLEDTNLTQC